MRWPALPPPDGREPGGRTVLAVEPRPNPVRLDGREIPTGLRVERRSQLVLADRVGTRIRALFTEAEHVQSSTVDSHRPQARHISAPFVAVEGVEQSAVQHRVEPAP